MAHTEDDQAHRIATILAQLHQARGDDAAGMISEAAFLISLGSQRRCALPAADYVALLVGLKRAEEEALECLPVEFTREEVLRGFEGFRGQLELWTFGATAVLAADAKARCFRNGLHNVELEKLIAKVETGAAGNSQRGRGRLFPNVIRIPGGGAP